MKNAFSVDVEDWFCVHNFSDIISMEQWDNYELRVTENTIRLLDIFEKHNVTCTFFILGWIAKKCPDLIKQIAERGHEIASHGYWHQLVKNLSPEEFRINLEKSIETISDIVKTDIKGFRAPSFSIRQDKQWIFEVLKSCGISYDSSEYPVFFHPDYSESGNSLNIYNISHGLTEVPLSCFRFAGLTFPCGGGAYLRILPYNYTASGIKRCHLDNRPAVIYTHPWEIDPEQPKVNKLPALKKIRHYYNLDKTEQKIEKLLSQFEFTKISSIVADFNNRAE